QGLWKGMGSETPFSYYYYPFHKGYSADWKIPPYDPERAKKLLAEAGHGQGFEVRVNPMVMVYSADGPDIMEAVALDWEKVGIKSITWAMTKKVNAWQTLAYVPMETNYVSLS